MIGFSVINLFWASEEIETEKFDGSFEGVGCCELFNSEGSDNVTGVEGI
jgi:hypothetical protein